jgi:LPXTG-site transpeptidase (sortase) family protein
MYEGIELSTLDHGPGHWPGTAMPGQVGNVVVAGHRVSHNADFRYLDQLSPGNEVIFNTGGGRHVYSVVSTEIVAPDAMWTIDVGGCCAICLSLRRRHSKNSGPARRAGAPGLFRGSWLRNC